MRKDLHYAKIINTRTHMSAYILHQRLNVCCIRAGTGRMISQISSLYSKIVTVLTYRTIETEY